MGELPAGAVTVTSNRELFETLNGPRPWPAVWLCGGDLALTLGVSPQRRRPTLTVPSEGVFIAPVDVAEATHDGGSHVFAGQAIARRSWWRGPLLAVANAQYLGPWDLAPRSHPNDGWLDVVEVRASMRARQRFLAWRRLPTARHVPHPDITTRRVHESSWTFPQPLDVWLDGVSVGRSGRLTVEVEPDALTVCVSPGRGEAERS